MENKLYELNKQASFIRSQQSNPSKFSWPADFKQLIISLVKVEKVHYRDISKATGIAESTLYGWIQNKPKVKNTFKPVYVKSNTDQNLTLSWQSGLIIEGLSFSQIEELLKQGLL